MRRRRSGLYRRPAGLFRSRLLLVVVVAVVCGAASCGGGGETVESGLTGPGELRGGNVGVADVAGASTLETRYLLQEAYGLDVDLASGDIAFVESTADSLAGLLRDGVVIAASMPPTIAFRLTNDESVRILTHVTTEVQELTGGAFLSSLLVTYPDVVGGKPDALREVRRMLAESITYFRANRSDVISAISESQQAEEAFLDWWWDRWDLTYGDLSSYIQERLLATWDAAMTIGDIEELPDLEMALLFLDDEEPGTLIDGDRTTLSIAFLDDASRRAALFAIDFGIVASETIDLDLSYLPPSEIAEAASAKQYDVIEASPLIVAGGAVRDLRFIVLSGGLMDIDGTLLFVLN